MVNEAFARAYYRGQNPVGRVFHLPWRNGTMRAITIIGLVGDARYRDLREPVPPVAYVPFRTPCRPNCRGRDERGDPRRATTPDLQALTTLIRSSVGRETPAIAVSSVRTQESVIAAQTARERLLAILGAFFALVALVLSAVGLYGVADYLVVMRRRDIGICLALGAPTARVARMAASGIVAMVALGGEHRPVARAGRQRYLEALLFGVTATDAAALATPAGIVLVVTALACSGPIAPGPSHRYHGHHPRAVTARCGSASRYRLGRRQAVSVSGGRRRWWWQPGVGAPPLPSVTSMFLSSRPCTVSGKSECTPPLTVVTANWHE